MKELVLLLIICAALLYAVYMTYGFARNRGQAEGWSEGFEEGCKITRNRRWNRITEVDVNGELFIRCGCCDGTGIAETGNISGECAECDLGNAATEKEQEEYRQYRKSL